MRCPNCGEEILLDLDECPACGDPLDNGSEDKKRRNLGDKIKSAEKKIDEKLAVGLDEGQKEIKPESKLDEVSDVGEDIKSRTRTSAGSQFRMVDLDDRKDLMWIDERFEEEFTHEDSDLELELGDNWPKTKLCEDLDEFAEKMVENRELSDRAREGVKKAEKRRSINTKGVNLPGDGFYLNGAYFLKEYGMDNTKELLADSESLAYKDMIKTICHEKLGHGFVDMCTLLGRELIENNLRRIDLADKFKIDTSLTPDWEIAQEKWDIIFENMVYLQEGYATWIENRMSEFLGLDFATDYDWSVFPSDLDIFEDLKYLIKEKRDISVEDIERIKSIAEKNREIFEELGKPPRYILGHLIFRKLEESIGYKNVPYAVKIACNIEFDLAEISVSDLERLMEKDKFNIDTRILQLSRLALKEKNDPDLLKATAYQGLNMPY